MRVPRSGIAEQANLNRQEISPSIGCRKRRRRWITLVSIRIRQVVLLGYRISYLSIPWCAKSRPEGRRHYRAFKATFLQLSSDLFHPEAVCAWSSPT